MSYDAIIDELKKKAIDTRAERDRVEELLKKAHKNAQELDERWEALNDAANAYDDAVEHLESAKEYEDKANAPNEPTPSGDADDSSRSPMDAVHDMVGR